MLGPFLQILSHNQGFIEKKPQGEAKVQLIRFRGRRYKFDTAVLCHIPAEHIGILYIWVGGERPIGIGECSSPSARGVETF